MLHYNYACENMLALSKNKGKKPKILIDADEQVFY